jgi:polysaccharide biosynthesis protein PslG
MNKRLFIVVALLFISAIPLNAQSCALCGSGVNINFAAPQPGELELLRAAGFRWVRIDFKWDVTEFEKGRYDFSPYERWLSALDAVGIQALFILDYGNPLYDGGAPPRSAQTREAFTRWAVAAAKKFRGRGVIWELYNEPNHDQFWPPRPDAEEYSTLALAVGAAFMTQVPNEVLIGPALSEIDLNFLETCFKRGVLKYWSAVSVHPYKRGDPETVVSDYAALRRLIDKYAPSRQIPIVSSEWGYSTAWPGITEAKQSELLVRSWLINLSQGVRLSIWYDWRDDGLDKREAEHNFGILFHRYQPKLAYLAVRTFNQFLAGYVFEQRVKLASESDYMLVFRKGSEKRFAVWTTDRPHMVRLSLDPGLYERVDHLGSDLGKVKVGSPDLHFHLGNSPIYLRNTIVRFP